MSLILWHGTADATAAEVAIGGVRYVLAIERLAGRGWSWSWTIRRDGRPWAASYARSRGEGQAAAEAYLRQQLGGQA